MFFLIIKIDFDPLLYVKNALISIAMSILPETVQITELLTIDILICSSFLFSRCLCLGSVGREALSVVSAILPVRSAC